MSEKSILLLADPILPVPPPLYGGIERIVDFLAEGLASRGWKVTLACHPNSTCGVSRVSYPTDSLNRNSRLRNAGFLLPRFIKGNFDLVHSFAHPDLSLALWPFKQPLIQSFQAVPHWGAFSKRTRFVPKKNLHFTTCGHHMVERFSKIAPTHGIHNGVRIEQFDFQPSAPPDAPLVFLGRIEPIKGTHTAIEITKATNRRLIIAGNRSDNPTMDRYFREKVEPHLCDQISYVGSVNNVQKNKLLGSAAAFLMPIEWDEPFGIVMAEALACGTPVIGTARGALPEIVTGGVTGKGCENVAEMIRAVETVSLFSREECRKSAETRFSSDIIVNQYINLYTEILRD